MKAEYTRSLTQVRLELDGDEAQELRYDLSRLGSFEYASAQVFDALSNALDEAPLPATDEKTITFTIPFEGGRVNPWQLRNHIAKYMRESFGVSVDGNRITVRGDDGPA